MTEQPDPVPGAEEVSRARALELLDEQRRRILELCDAVAAGQRRVRQSMASLSWRSPSRYEFDVRLGELQADLARSAALLGAALAECERARSLLTGPSVERRGHGWEKVSVGSPGRAR